MTVPPYRRYSALRSAVEQSRFRRLSVAMRHFCVLLEKQPTYRFLLPESTYSLTFLHATKRITIVTRQPNIAGSIVVPKRPPVSDAELATYTRDYYMWTVPDNAYRLVDYKNLSHSARHIVDLILKYKVVYLVNLPLDSFAELQNVYTVWTSQGGANAGMQPTGEVYQDVGVAEHGHDRLGAVTVGSGDTV